jgi:hypothetical protein
LECHRSIVINLCFREIYALSSKLHTALLMMFYDLVVRLLTAHSLVNVVGMSFMVSASGGRCFSECKRNSSEKPPPSAAESRKISIALILFLPVNWQYSMLIA